MAENTIPKAVKRFKIADYYGITASQSVTYSLMGTGFEKIDESPNAQVDTVHYVNMVSASSDVSRYEPEFAFDSDMIASEDVIMDIYDIGTRQKTGEDAVRSYVRVELFRPHGTVKTAFKARKFSVTVGVSSISGNGGENIKISGSLKPVEDCEYLIWALLQKQLYFDKRFPNYADKFFYFSILKNHEIK